MQLTQLNSVQPISAKQVSRVELSCVAVNGPLNTQSFIIILIEIWTFNRKLDGSIFLDYMFVSSISIDSLKGLSTGMVTFLSVIYDGV